MRTAGVKACQFPKEHGAAGQASSAQKALIANLQSLLYTAISTLGRSCSSVRPGQTKSTMPVPEATAV